MTTKKHNLIDQNLQDLNNDGVDRRGFLKCMAWAGTGLVWTMSGGIPASRAFAKVYGRHAGKSGRHRNVTNSDQQNQCHAAQTRFHYSHRRSESALEAE